VVFEDRSDAGRRLADRLRGYPGLQGDDVVVLGLPRGGVPVAAEVADALGAPLDVIVVRKLGVPGHPELAMGALGEGGTRILDTRVVGLAGVQADDVVRVQAREERELARRLQRYRAVHPRAALAGRVALIVDDGLATGATARAACQVARHLGAARVVVAVPVAPADWVDRLGDVADDLVAVETPTSFRAVGEWYRRFEQTSDEEVLRLLAPAAAPGRVAPGPSS
jgi:putative phosphoribosyl transferase